MSTEIVEKKDIEQIAEIPAQQHMAEQSQTDRFVELALKSGDMQQLEKMLELKQRYDKEEARKAFTAALADFKSENITIDKDRKVSFKNNDGSYTKYSHASLGNIVEKAVPIMAKYGLTHRWDTEQTDGYIKTICILTHKAGYSEQTSPFTSGADSSGKKNPIQQIASAIHYQQRYTFLAITGLATSDMDDDGAGVAPEEPITLDQQTVLTDLIKDTGADEKLFLEYMKCATLGEMPASLYTRAKRALESKKK